MIKHALMRTAKTLCAEKGWSLSNLGLQKLVYLSHLMHLGRHKRPLVEGTFEAWALGPVHPDLYRKVRAYGDRSIPDIFAGDAYEPGSDERGSIDIVLDQVGAATPGQLVAITHWSDGAWAKNYRPNVMAIPIPNADIAEEYAKLAARSAAR